MNVMHFVNLQRNKSKYYKITRENQIEVLYPFLFELNIFEVEHISLYRFHKVLQVKCKDFVPDETSITHIIIKTEWSVCN